MCTLTQIESEYEQRISHALYGEREPLHECCICWSCFAADYPGWRIGHNCAEGMDENDVWCCSRACEAKWVDKHWEEIAEYEEFEEENEA